VIRRAAPYQRLPWALNTERWKLFLVNLAVGEGEFRHGGTAAFHHESGNRHHLRLVQFLAGCDLSGLQKSFDHFAFAADRHAGEFLEPFALRHFRFGVRPIRQRSQLIGGNLSSADAVEQMVKKERRKTVASNSRHGYSP
jgi:hypothetical protein